MERFKDILRVAVRQHAETVKLEVGKNPTLKKQSSTIELNEQGVVEPDLINSLFDFLFPYDREKLQQNIPIKGVLNIPNVGRLNLIGTRSPTSYIKLYFPAATNEFEEDFMSAEANSHQDQGSNSAAETPDHEPADQNNTLPPPPPNIPVPNGGSIPLKKEMPKSPYAVQAMAQAQGSKEKDEPKPKIVTEGAITSQIAKMTESLKSKAEQEMEQYGPTEGEVSPAHSQEEENPFQLDGEETQDQDEAAAPNIDSEPELTKTSLSQESHMVHTVAGDAEPAQFEYDNQDDKDGLKVTFSENVCQEFPPEEKAAQEDLNPESEPVFSTQPELASEPNLEQPSAHSDYLNQAVGFNPSNEAAENQTIIDKFLEEMARMNASDLHLAVGKPPTFRIDGLIDSQPGETITQPIMSNLIDSLSHQRKSESQSSFRYQTKNEHSFRVNLFEDIHGQAASIRAIPKTLPGPVDLHHYPQLCEAAQLREGLVLVNGGVGSGKTTTLNVIINHMNECRRAHVFYTGCPVEYIHSSHKSFVSQVDLESFDADRFRKEFNHCDADVVVLPEISNYEQFKLALDLAEYGCLVLACTLGKSASNVLESFLEDCPEASRASLLNSLSRNLRVIVSQVLLQQKAGGRIASAEVLNVDETAKSMIADGKLSLLTSHIQAHASPGSQTLEESLIKHVKSGTIDYKEAHTKCLDEDRLQDCAAKEGIQVDSQSGESLKINQN